MTMTTDLQVQIVEDEPPAGKSRWARLMSRLEQRSKNAQRRAIIEFQSDAVEIDQTPPPWLAYAAAHALLAFFVAAIAWASFAHVDRIVVAPGKLVTTAAQIVVQPLETAVIKEIRVRAGDIVREGQVVALLDSTFSGADLAQLDSQRRSFAAQIERLTAQYHQKPYAPADLSEPSAMLQIAIYNERRATDTARLTDLEEQIAQYRAAVETLKDNAKTLEYRAKVAEQIEEMRLELQRRDVGSKLQSLAAHDQRLQIVGELDSVRNRKFEVEHQLRSLQAQRSAYEAGQQQEIAKELIEITRQYDNVMDSLRKARHRDELAELRAPRDGVVLMVAERTVGSVLQAAEPLVTLVPLDSPLEAEVRIAPEDVGHLRGTLPARIKLDAFPFQKHGFLEGELITISHNTFTVDNRPDGPAYFRGTVRLTTTTLRNTPEDTKLLPGMTLTAEAKLGERSVLSYLLYPLMSTFDEGMREP